MTDSISLYIGYSKDVIRASGGSRRLINHTNVYTKLVEEFLKLYDSTTNRKFMIRRIGISFRKCN